MAIQAGLLNKTEIAYAHSKMLANVAAAGGKTTLGLALYPPYPNGSFSYGMDPYEYQNAVRKTASFFGVFSMFVPSLSWQNDRFYT